MQALLRDALVRPHPWYTVLPLTAIVAFLLTLTGVWQLILVAGLLAGLLLRETREAFLVGLGAGGLAWGIPLGVASALYPLGEAASLLLRILGLSGGEVFLPYLLAIAIGAVVTALGGALGAYLYALLQAAREELEQMA